MRTLTTGQLTAVDSRALECCWLIEMQFDSGTMRITTAGHDIDWNGFTWVGGGLLLSVEPIVEATTLEALGTKVTLSGVSTAVLSLALSEPTQGRTVIVRSVFRDIDTRQIIDTPPVEMQGVADVPQIEIGPDSSFKVSITVESDLADFSRPNVRRYTDADHQARYPGDKFFEYVGSVVLEAIVWPTGDALR